VKSAIKGHFIPVKRGQKEPVLTLLHLSRMIRETLFDRKSLIDILTLHPEHRKDMKPEMMQGSLF